MFLSQIKQHLVCSMGLTSRAPKRGSAPKRQAPPVRPVVETLESLQYMSATIHDVNANGDVVVEVTGDVGFSKSYTVVTASNNADGMATLTVSHGYLNPVVTTWSASVDTPIFGVLIQGDGTNNEIFLNGQTSVFGGALISVDSGDGNDLIGAAVDTSVMLNGGAGNDGIICGGMAALAEGSSPVFISGGSGNDNLQGSQGFDVINGGSGNDYLQGNTGNDQLFGGSGNDRLWGNQGDDSLNGGVGDDYLRGNSGNDVYYLDLTFRYQGREVLDDTSGRDSIYYAKDTNFKDMTIKGRFEVYRLVPNAPGV
ncbi:MAG: calcium-binding protein [Patescibacteria group bacterium]